MLGMMHVYSPQQPNPIVDDFKRERETIFLDNVKLRMRLLFFFNFKNFINTLENTKFDVY